MELFTTTDIYPPPVHSDISQKPLSRKKNGDMFPFGTRFAYAPVLVPSWRYVNDAPLRLISCVSGFCLKSYKLLE
jgi:hypothetical protein